MLLLGGVIALTRQLQTSAMLVGKEMARESKEAMHKAQLKPESRGA